MQNGSAAVGRHLPPIYTDLERQTTALESAEPGKLIKVPEGFFSTDHPNTRMIVNLISQGDQVRLRQLMEQKVGAYAMFQVVDRGSKGNRRSLFHKQAILYLSLIGLAVYWNHADMVSAISKAGGSSLLRTQFATGVQNSEDILCFPTEYIAVMMESFDCLGPLMRHGFWNAYATTHLTYRRRYLQCRTPIIGYPDLLRCALLRSANYNLTGFFITAKREATKFSLSRLIYLGSVMVQHFHINTDTGQGTRRVFNAAAGPRFVLPNLCSVSRRLLTLAVYQDPNMRLLSQVLGALRECAHAGAYQVLMPAERVKASLLLWLQELVSLETASSMLFRTLGAATEKLLTEGAPALYDHYLRYDALNCMSLLLGLLCRFNPGASAGTQGFGYRIMDAASAIALQSGLADPLLTFAWPDSLLALRSLINPADADVGFDQFKRWQMHLPTYASSVAATNPEARGADRWRVSVRHSLLMLDWANTEREMFSLMSGELTVPLVTSTAAAIQLQVSHEQAADRYRDLQAEESSMREFDYAAFYRLFQHRYSMWACSTGLEPHERPRPLEFREDRAFIDVYPRAKPDA